MGTAAAVEAAAATEAAPLAPSATGVARSATLLVLVPRREELLADMAAEAAAEATVHSEEIRRGLGKFTLI